MNQFFSITPKGLSLSDIRNIISNRLRLSLSSDSVERINTNRRYLEEKLKNNDQAFYGINTGFGSLCDQKISNEELKKLQINLVISHACGVGKEIELPIVKIMLLLKINALSFGFSGIRLQTVEKLIFFFNNDILPVVFESGSLGASGDLAPLAHLSLPLIGEGMVYYQNKKVKSSELLRNLNQEIIELDSKEGLALLNGTQFMAAQKS